MSNSEGLSGSPWWSCRVSVCRQRRARPEGSAPRCLGRVGPGDAARGGGCAGVCWRAAAKGDAREKGLGVSTMSAHGQGSRPWAKGKKEGYHGACQSKVTVMDGGGSA